VAKIVTVYEKVRHLRYVVQIMVMFTVNPNPKLFFAVRPGRVLGTTPEVSRGDATAVDPATTGHNSIVTMKTSQTDG